MKRLVCVTEGQNNFDAIRLAMALLVVWSHSFALHLGSEQTEWISITLNGACNAGNLGVMAFFVISGFLITKSFERSRSLKSYFEKRVKRIYPGYLVAVSICAFIIAPLFGGDHPGGSFGLNIFLRNEIPDAFAANPSHAVNGSLWSIPFEFWCYIGVAVGGLFLVRKPRLLVGLCILVMLGKVVQDLSGKTPSFGLFGVIFGWPYIWTRIAPSFILGMIAYTYELPRSRTILIGLAGAAISACWLNRHLADMMVAPALAYGVFYIAFSDRIKLRNAARFGDFSYGTYLYAFPIQQILQATTDLSLPEFIAVSAVLSLVAGALSWWMVERWFLVRKSADSPSAPNSGPRWARDSAAFVPVP